MQAVVTHLRKLVEVLLNFMPAIILLESLCFKWIFLMRHFTLN